MIKTLETLRCMESVEESGLGGGEFESLPRMHVSYCPLIQHMVNTNSTVHLASVTMVWLHGLISALGILENLLILWVIGFRVPRSVLSIWILNLATSDLLATAMLPFFTVYLAKGSTWTLGTTFCKIQSSVFFLNMFVSGFLLAAISLDRCLVSLWPVWSQNYRDVGLAWLVCGILWVFAVINTVPYYLFRDTIKRHDGRVICYYNYMQLSPAGANATELCGIRQDAMTTSKFLLAFFLPLLVIVGSYIAVSSSIRRRGHRPTYRFFRLVVAVVVSFVLCWVPYHVFSLLEAAAHYKPELRPLVEQAMPSVASLAFINSVLNPMLYVFSCPDFLAKIRQSLSTVIETVLVEDLGDTRCRRKNTRSSGSTSDHRLCGLYPFPFPSQRRSGSRPAEDQDHPAVF